MPKNNDTKMELTPQDFNRKSIRLKDYNYSTAGNYFITIVVNERKHLLGLMANERVLLNDAGRMVEDYLKRIPQIHTNASVTDHVIMPNHIHLILHLDGDLNHETGNHVFEVMRRMKSQTTLQYMHGVREHHWQPFHRHLWQRNYFEHIIRNQRSFDYIRGYIIDNPKRWKYDSLNSEHTEQVDNIMSAITMLT